MGRLTSEMERIQWRRDKVQELSSKGHSQIEIASILQMTLGSVNRDLTYIRQQSKNNIKKYIDERLPEEYEKCLVGLNAIVKEAWTTSEQAEDKREKIQALSLAKECNGMRLDLLTNATVVDNAIRFVRAQEIHNYCIIRSRNYIGGTKALKLILSKTLKMQSTHLSPSTTTNQVF